MSTNTETTPAGFWSRSKKAVAGGVTAAVTAGSTAVATAFSDGTFDQADGWIVLTAVVGGFAVGFAGVWAAPANAT